MTMLAIALARAPTRSRGPLDRSIPISLLPVGSCHAWAPTWTPDWVEQIPLVAESVMTTKQGVADGEQWSRKWLGGFSSASAVTARRRICLTFVKARALQLQRLKEGSFSSVVLNVYSRINWTMKSFALSVLCERCWDRQIVLVYCFELGTNVNHVSQRQLKVTTLDD
jgi:hypothetical protein